MQRFRPPSSLASAGDVSDLLAVGQLIDDVLKPGHFFADPTLRLAWIAARSETIHWELFRGRLLDAKQTRDERTFLSWHIVQGSADEALVSVKLDVRSRHIHVTRGVLCHAWEAYDSGGGVIESREMVQWTRELVGTIVLAEYAELESVRDELICLTWQAVVGTSRLPLTSVEAPLPAFTFGQLHYLYSESCGEEPITSWQAWLLRGLQTPCARRETVKLVEFTLRHIKSDEAPRFAEPFRRHVNHADAKLPRLLRGLFNDLSLSPYTHFVDNAVAWIGELGQTEFLGVLLRQLGRHLTAYDLITFHHRGANYPDALLLDAALKTFLRGPLETRQERCALRQACLLRRHYQGHPVPDLPTSPGENARVLPTSYPRVSGEQLTQPQRRRRQLFADAPLSNLLTDTARSILAQSVQDLQHLDERVEMGMGLFIDRPLGYGKEVAEPDLTPLLAHEAFSPSLARRRWRELKQFCAELEISIDAASLDESFENGPWPAGLASAELAEAPRPVAALADVRKVAGDFVILRTLPVGLGELLRLFDWRQLTERFRLRFLAEGPPRLFVQAIDHAGGSVLTLFDGELRRRVELHVDARQGFQRRAGVEWPRAGLQVVAVWEDTDDPAVLRRQAPDLVLQPSK